MFKFLNKITTHGQQKRILKAALIGFLAGNFIIEFLKIFLIAKYTWNNFFIHSFITLSLDYILILPVLINIVITKNKYANLISKINKMYDEAKGTYHNDVGYVYPDQKDIKPIEIRSLYDFSAYLIQIKKGDLFYCFKGPVDIVVISASGGNNTISYYIEEYINKFEITDSLKETRLKKLKKLNK